MNLLLSVNLSASILSKPVIISTLDFALATITALYEYDSSSIILGANTYGYNGILPPWLDFDTNTGIFTGVPDSNTDVENISIYGINDDGQGNNSSIDTLVVNDIAYELRWDGILYAIDSANSDFQYVRYNLETEFFYTSVESETRSIVIGNHDACSIGIDPTNSRITFSEKGSTILDWNFAILGQLTKARIERDTSVVRLYVNDSLKKTVSKVQTNVTNRFFKVGASGAGWDGFSNILNYAKIEWPDGEYPDNHWTFDSGSIVTEASDVGGRPLNYINVTADDWVCEILISGILDFTPAAVGEPYEFDASTIIVNAITYGYNGALPPWLDFDVNTGIFSGTPDIDTDVVDISVYGINSNGNGEDSNTDTLIVSVCKLTFDGTNYGRSNNADLTGDFVVTYLNLRSSSSGTNTLARIGNSDQIEVKRYLNTTYVYWYSNGSQVHSELDYNITPAVDMNLEIKRIGDTYTITVKNTDNTVRGSFTHTYAGLDFEGLVYTGPTFVGKLDSVVVDSNVSWIFNSGYILAEPSEEYPNDSNYDMAYINVTAEDWTCT